AADPVSVSVLPSAETTSVVLYISLPSFFQVRSRALAPFFAIAQVHPEGHNGPVAGWSLPSNLASQAPPSFPIDRLRPSLPFGVRLIVSGELVLRFLVFHLPASPGPPETRWNDMESLEVPPSALTRLESSVSILPSAESFILPVEVILPLVFSVISQVLAS